jgi:hypothetical protein
LVSWEGSGAISNHRALDGHQLGVSPLGQNNVFLFTLADGFRVPITFGISIKSGKIVSLLDTGEMLPESKIQLTEKWVTARDGVKLRTLVFEPMDQIFSMFEDAMITVLHSLGYPSSLKITMER